MSQISLVHGVVLLLEWNMPFKVIFILFWVLFDFGGGGGFQAQAIEGEAPDESDTQANNKMARLVMELEEAAR